MNISTIDFDLSLTDVIKIKEVISRSLLYNNILNDSV
jgi:hypothetical protein